MKPRDVAEKLWQFAAQVPVTLSLGLLVIGIACVPAANEALQFDRAAIGGGEVWRLATCHLTHWNAEHIRWDLLMFLVLGAICETKYPGRMRLCLIVAVTCVSAVVYFFFPSINAYRGLSGIDTALFTLLAVDLMHDAYRESNRAMLTAASALLAGFAIKTSFEVVAGHALFVDQHAAGFGLLIWDHIVAAIVGIVIGSSNEWHIPIAHQVDGISA